MQGCTIYIIEGSGRVGQREENPLRLSSERRFGVCYGKVWGWEKGKEGANVELDLLENSFQNAGKNRFIFISIQTLIKPLQLDLLKKTEGLGFIRVI